MITYKARLIILMGSKVTLGLLVFKCQSGIIWGHRNHTTVVFPKQRQGSCRLTNTECLTHSSLLELDDMCPLYKRSVICAYPTVHIHKRLIFWYFDLIFDCWSEESESIPTPFNLSLIVINIVIINILCLLLYC